MGGTYLDSWENVSGETGFDHHWHHGDSDPGNYLSIRMTDESKEGLGGYGTGWSVEIYPDPDKNSPVGDEMTRWHYPPDEYPCPSFMALLKVLELMERHA